MLNKIETEKAPKAIGPYSQAIVSQVGGQSLIFVSGQLPINPQTGELMKGTIEELTAQVLKNIEQILKDAGASLEQVVRTDVFLKDLKNFKAMNEEYGRHFKGPLYPARQTIQVADLPLGSPIEISCIAVKM